jgi:WD40 repeat protein
LNSHVWIWDLEAGTAIEAFQCPDGIWAVAISARGHRIAAGGGQANGARDWRIRLFEREIGHLKEIEGNRDAVTALEITPDDRILLSGSRDGMIRAWDIDTGIPLRTFGEPYSAIREERKRYIGSIMQMLVTPDGRRVVVLNNDGDAWICSLATGQFVGPLRTHHGSKGTARITPDGKWLITGAGLRNIFVWNIDHAGLEIATAELAEQSCFSLRGRILAAGDQTGNVAFYRFANLPQGPPVVTAHRNGKSPCPSCNRDFMPPQSVVASLEATARAMRPRFSNAPCLDWPGSAWDGPELRAACPVCSSAVLFNPFFAGGK